MIRCVRLHPSQFALEVKCTIADCELTFLAFTISCICEAVCIMVLQEGTGLHKVSPCLLLAIDIITHRRPASHRKKREAKIKRDVKRGIREANEQNPFEIFVTVTDIRYTCVRFLLTSAHFSCELYVNDRRLLGTTRSRIRFWGTRMGCACCRTLRRSRRICWQGRSRPLKEGAWWCCF